MSVEMLANFVQAVLAAAYVQAGTVEALEAQLPDVVADFLVEQGGRSTRDAATRLQELAVELDLEWPWTDRQTGPDHAPNYRNTMRVSGGSASVVVEGAGPGRTAAKKAAAAVAMAAAGLRSGVPTVVDRPHIARFFPTRQLEVLAAKPNRWPRWQQQNVLGARHVADRDWAAFGRWTDAVRRAGFLDLPVPTTARESLAEFYQRAARSAGARPRFADTLSRVLRWVGGAVADDRTILQPEPWEDLVALTAAHGVWLAAHGTADLAVMLERWARPERRRVPVEIEAAGPADAGAQAAAAVARILQELRQAASGVAPELRVRLVPGGTTHEIRLSPGTGGAPGSASLIALVCEAASGIAVEHGDGGTTVQVAGRATGSGWLWEAASRPGHRPDAVAVANSVRYGLAAAVFTRDLGQALATVPQLHVGMVKVNAPTSGVDFHAPFGGTKDSSYGPREQGPAAREFFSETVTVTIASG